MFCPTCEIHGVALLLPLADAAALDAQEVTRAPPPLPGTVQYDRRTWVERGQFGSPFFFLHVFFSQGSYARAQVAMTTYDGRTLDGFLYTAKVGEQA